MNEYAKKEAERIFNEMLFHIEYNCQPSLSFMVAKQCAIVCVNKLIEVSPENKSIVGTKYLTVKELYKEVKKYLENDLDKL